MIKTKTEKPSTRSPARDRVSARRIPVALGMLGGLFAAAGAAQAAEPGPWGMGLQDAATPVMESTSEFHDLLLIIITFIVVFVLGLLAYVVWRFNAKRNPVPSKTSHNTLIEVIWTAVPVLILLIIAVPSFRLLYFQDQVEDPELTVVVTGHRWYWSYEFPDQQIDRYDSFMLADEQIGEGQLRLLSVDKPLVLPADTTVQVLIRASDVLHAFAVPAFGVKTDAVPGQTNHTWLRVAEEGTYYGQCSELCGSGHAYMPIEVEIVSREAFDDWVMEQVAGRELEEPPVLLTRSYEEALAALELAGAPAEPAATP